MKQVALLIESSRSYGRGLLEGVAAYVRTHRRWSLRHQEISINADPPDWLFDWQGDGILARIETEEMVAAIRTVGIPTVDVRSSKKLAGVPRITIDDQSVVQLALDHLRERGVRRFAFCGFAGADYSVRRLRIFRDLLAADGFEPEVYESRGPVDSSTMEAELKGMLDSAGVTHWLRKFEKPVGLLASNDIRAQQVLQCCEDAGIAVPDDIAVVGVDNDEVICSLCQPNLSSIELNTQKIGYDAAAMLEHMMAGGASPAELTLVPPKQVIVRGSTDVVAIEDRTTAAAYRYLRDHACESISVDDVVRQVPLSRRSLERRIRQHFGRSPAELIAEIRLARIKQLLEETDFPLKKISGLTGFFHDEHMAVFFRKHVGHPPGQYRKKWRAVHGVGM
jgi:LacI family transcriptional regulator